MSPVYTVDASVFVSAFNEAETDHEASARLLSGLRRTGAGVVDPYLVLVEVAAAVARVRQDAELATEFAHRLGQLSALTLVPLDAGVARQSIEAAAHHRLRGSDAVYAAIAARFGSTLITLDREQRERLLSFVPVRYPSEVLKEIAGV